MRKKIFGSKLKQNHAPLTFGGAAISGEGGGYGFGEISEKDAIELLDYAFDLGIRFFDTAPIYGFGLSEQRMGKAFRQRRDQVFLVSKSGVDWHPTHRRVNMSNLPAITQRMLEESLLRLQTDWIDLYMVHWPDPQVDIRKTLEVLVQAQKEGKIKHIGLCNTYPEDLAKAMEVANIEVVQSEFNCFAHFPKQELFPLLKEHSIEFMSWGTLAKGILTGRVHKNRRDFDASDARSWAPWWKKSNKAELMEKAERMNLWLQERGHTLLEMALAHNIMHKEVSTLICGARTKSQLDSLLTASQNLPSDELVKECLLSLCVTKP